MITRIHGIDRHKKYSTVSVLDRVEATGATCYILDSWNKTDRQDARNMAKALWVFLVTGEFGIPTVYKPSETIRTLRRLFVSDNVPRQGSQRIPRRPTRGRRAIGSEPEQRPRPARGEE